MKQENLEGDKNLRNVEESSPDEDDEMGGQNEMHDFRPLNLDEQQDPNSDGKLIKPLAVGTFGRNRNKVVPIMEVPSSESELSSKRGGD